MLCIFNTDNIIGEKNKDGDDPYDDKDSNSVSHSSESWGLLDNTTDKAMDVAWVRGS